MDHPNHTKQVQTQDGPFTMVVETNRATVWPDRPQNKYDPSAHKIFHYYLQEQQRLMNKVHLEGWGMNWIYKNIYQENIVCNTFD